MLVRLLSMPEDFAGTTGGFLVTVAVLWGCVWLLAQRLAAWNAGTRLFFAFAVMLSIGVLASLGRIGFTMDQEATLWVGFVAGASVALLAGMMLGRYFCGESYRAKRFLTWLLLWTVLMNALSTPLMVILAMGTAMIQEGEFAVLALAMMIGQVIALAVAGAFLGIVYYLVNLPFILLAQRCPLYRGRLFQALGFQDVPEFVPAPVEPAEALAHSYYPGREEHHVGRAS